ncbi:MAG: hypothetical protein IIB05_11570 [Bacteroidetes bacterium]|nr:hypothetical protein [Bacteroidota bacterium]
MRKYFFQMPTTITMIIIFLFSCAGDGLGLYEDGDPTGSSIDSLTPGADSTALTATLESIQTNIFDAVCAEKCHKSPRPKKGLNLEDGEAYINLVNEPSEGKPSMMRAKPFDSEDSYIIWKLEGRSGISGKQMPLNLNPLPDEQINAIRDWIDLGAPE